MKIKQRTAVSLLTIFVMSSSAMEKSLMESAFELLNKHSRGDGNGKIIEKQLIKLIPNNCTDRAFLERLLFEAAGKGFKKLVICLCDRGVKTNVKLIAYLDEPNAKRNEIFIAPGITALHWAAANGDLETAEILLSYGADCFIHDDRGNSVLRYAVLSSNLELVNMLLDRNCVIDDKNKDGAVNLSEAIVKRSCDIVKLLVERGALVNMPDQHGTTPLIYALDNGNIEIAEYLLANGASATMEDYEGATALQVVEELTDPTLTALFKRYENTISFASLKDIEEVKSLQALGIAANTLDKDGDTLLITAIRNGKKEIVDFLLHKNYDVNGRNRFGLTALTIAAERGDDALVGRLLEAGAHPNNQDHYGDTALMRAVLYEHVDAVKVLLHAQAAVNIQNFAKKTALMFACQFGNHEMVRLLLEAGAQPDLKDYDGNSALAWAANGGADDVIQFCLGNDATLEIVTMLLDYKADINTLNKEKFTPWMIAHKQGNVKVATLLEDRGAALYFLDNAKLENRLI